MKIALALALALCFSTAALADESVRGYTRKDGTYVAPYMRTEPNNTRLDNYSTQGNTNPYTGQPGTHNPYPTPTYGQTPQPIYNSQPAYNPQPTYNPQP